MFALLIQIWAAAAIASPTLSCSTDAATLAVAVLAAPCCDDHGADRLGATGTESHFDAGSGIGIGMGGEDVSDRPPCVSCAGDCGGTASPVVHAHPAGSPVTAASSAPTPTGVTSHLPPTPHRLDRPPSHWLY